MEYYVVISFIGEGSFGRVFKAKHKETDAVVALKVIRKKGRSSKDLKNLRQECDIQRQLNHPNIIRMIDSFDTETELVVVTEYAERELHSILAKEGCLNEEHVRKITWDLVSALYYLHSHRVLHRDLKPQNVLLDSTGRAKLCDFGLARIMTNATHILTSIKGTPLYMAPELIDEKPYDHQADLWSLGCIVYELMAGQPPFCTMSIWQLVRMIRHKPVQWPSFISMDARSFLQGLLHKDPIRRMTWPEILEHPFVSGHVLILPEDIQSESPFTKPLTSSQQEAKQLQKEKINNNSRPMELNESIKIETREHDLRNVRVMQAMECVPMSDDDSVRATSAFSVRDSLKTDDEDQSQPISAANAKLLRHEYNVMNNSNLVVGNLENNMAHLMVTNKKQELNVNKMDKIVEEKQVIEKIAEDKVIINSEDKQEIVETISKPKSVDTASHSLENPKSSTKCSSDVSSGLSKSVPPSYKQKILQFSRDKLRFGSAGNRLTRSIKRSFHFSRSWDKNKSDNQRRTSEPAADISNIIDNEKETFSKEDKDEDIEKCEMIEETSDKELADNDNIIKTEEKHEVKEPTSIELEEWEAFLNSNISEVMDGDVESLTQINMVSMVVGVVGSAALCGGGSGARVCGAVAALLALPPLARALPSHTLLNIQDVYLEAKVVFNFVAAINTLMKHQDTEDGSEDRVQGVSRMMEVCSWLCVRSCRGVRQFATALNTYSAHAVFNQLLQELVNYCVARTSVTLVLACGVTLLAARLLALVREMRKLPPGPWGPPVVGYLPFIGVRHKTFLELARNYGALFSARLGNQLTVVLSDYRLIREAFRREEFTGRPSTPLMHTLEGLGIINSEGRLWKNQRRFLHEKLREFGMTYMGNGKKLMEGRIKNEVYELMANLHRSEGAPIDANPLLSLVVSNVICGITMSVRFSHGDPRFERLNHLIEEGMRLFGEIHYGEYIPLYNYLPGKAQAQERVIKNRQEMFEFYQTLIDEHRETLDVDNARDLIDVYLIEIEKAKTEGRGGELFEGRDHELQLKQILGDLFSAGMETIKSSLLWMIVFMLRNPDVKRRVQEEIDSVIGGDRLPTIEDMPNLPYTETTILETLRMSSIVPLATTHSPTRDVHLGGYRIPAGSQVVPLINCVHMDPNLWDEPNKFNPSRFIDETGKIRRPEYFMPFGVGRRMCLGDVLARMEMFMFFACMMHQFDVQLEAGAELPSLEGTVGATIAPEAFRVQFLPRQGARAPPPPALAPALTPDHPLLRHVGAH